MSPAAHRAWAAAAEGMTARDVIALRERLDLTQGGLAERLGVKRETVNRWEQGRCVVSPLALRALRAVERETVG